MPCTRRSRPCGSILPTIPGSLCLWLQRGCGVRGWGRDGLGTGARGRGARTLRALISTTRRRRSRREARRRSRRARRPRTTATRCPSVPRPRQARADRLEVLDDPPLAHEADSALELFGLLAPDLPFLLRGHRGAARGGEAAAEGRETGTALAPAEARHRSFVRTKAPREAIGSWSDVAIKKYSCIDSWWRYTLTAQEADDGYGARRNPGPGLFAVRGRA
jgi:hypothetical protein